MSRSEPEDNLYEAVLSGDFNRFYSLVARQQSNSFFWQLFLLVNQDNSWLSARENLLHAAVSGGDLLIFQAILNFHQQIKSDEKTTNRDFFLVENGKRQTLLQKLVSTPNANKHIAQILLASDGLEERSIETILDVARKTEGNEEIVQRILDYKFRKTNPTKYLENSVSLFKEACDIYDSACKEAESVKPPLVPSLVQCNKPNFACDLVNHSIRLLVDDKMIRGGNKKVNRASIADKCAEISDKYQDGVSTELHSLRSFLDETEREQEELLKERAKKQEEEAERLAALVPEDPKQRWQRYLNNTSPSTKESFIEEFERSGKDVSVVTKGLSVLQYAIQKRGDSDSVNAVLNSGNLSSQEIKGALVDAVKSNNRVLATIFLSNPTVIKLASELPDKNKNNPDEHLEGFFASIKSGDRQISQLVSGFRAAVAEVRKAAKPQQAEVETEKKLSKSELERRKKAQKAAKKEESLAEATLDEITNEVSEEVFEEVAQKAAAALKAEIEEVGEFLKGHKRISNIDQLPGFLRDQLGTLLQREDVAEVNLKGSAVYQWNRSLKTPNDLDLEIKVKGISGWDREKVVKFVEDHFGLTIHPSKIFKGWPGEEVFSVNAKDELRKIDISIYDPDKMPKNYQKFITNRERRVNVFSNGNCYYELHPESRNPLLVVENANIPNLNFLLNLRLVCGVINGEELGEYYWRNRESKNPAADLFKDFGIKDWDSGKIKESVTAKINHFAESHKLQKEALGRFCENLNWILDVGVSLQPDLAEKANLVKEAINSVKQEVDPAKEQVTPVSSAHSFNAKQLAKERNRPNQSSGRNSGGRNSGGRNSGR